MQKVAIEDFALIRKLGSLTLSPSGRKAAFTVTEGRADQSGYKTDIWVCDRDREPMLFRLTAGEDGKSPIFEDDGTILFPGDRKKKHTGRLPVTVYNRISLSGGEAEEAFVLPFAASGLTALGGGLWLCGGTLDRSLPDPVGMSDTEKETLEKRLEKDKAYEVFDELPFWYNGKGTINKKRTGLYLFDAAHNRTELLTDPMFQMNGFAVNPEKTKAVYWGTRFESLNRMKTGLWMIELAGRTVTKLVPDGKYAVEFAAFVGGTVLVGASDGAKYGTSQNEALYRVGPDGGLILLSEPDLSFGAVGSDIAGGGSFWQPADGIYTTRTDRYRSDYIRLNADGTQEVIADEIPMISAAVGSGDTVYMLGMEKDRPQEVYGRFDGRLVKLSRFNEAYMAEHETAVTEHFTFLDRDGVELDGWILKPADFDPAKTYPGILTVHGGPRSVYGEGFFHEMQYFAALGYVVFFCNPRGGSGRGDAFADILGEKFGVDDYNDVMDFTDAVLRRVPQLDPKRIGMTGGSYGGFMANWIIGHTDRFAAVASCRSISNYVSKCLTTDIGYYHNLSQIGADPWTDVKQMWEHSPLAYADRAVTPTLFIQSDEDYRCWMGDAVQMLQALLMHGVPARMCLFHGENHELSRSGVPEHRISRLREIADWMDRWLK